MCGYRHSGKDGVGIYLVEGPATTEPCPRLPFPLTVCPCCGHGIKFSRGYTWIDPTLWFDPELPPVTEWDHPTHQTRRCTLCNPAAVGHRAGLLWVGEQHYPTAAHFAREANEMGISRRISAVPRDFVPGKTVVYLAHIRTVPPKATDLLKDPKAPWQPGVFRTFVPVAVDLVIDDPDNIPEKAISLKERLGDGARIVKVLPDTEGETYEMEQGDE